MVTSRKSLLGLTAGDLMSREVVTLAAGMPLREAALRLARSSVRGAPVVDELGRCVGVLSVTDLARWAVHRASQRSPQRRPSPLCPWPQSHWLDWRSVAPDDLPEEEVRLYMTTDPVTATEDVPIRTLARRMLDASVHRVIVVDDHGRLVGVVSGTDLLAALAYAED